MKKGSFYGWIMIPALILLHSCDPFKQYQESVAVIEASSPTLDIKADGGEPVSLLLKSNRSWTASIEEGVDWLSMDIAENQNLEMRLVETQVSFTAEDNPVKASRPAKVSFISEAGKVDVTVVQGPLVPRLIVSGGELLENLEADAGTYTLTVESNVPWTVGLAPESTAGVSLSAESGQGNGTIELSVAENGSSSGGKDAVIIFTAEDCAPVSVNLHQKKAVAYMKFADAVDGVLTVEEGLFEAVIAVKTNSNWSAEIADVDGFTNPMLTKPTGSSEDQSITVRMDCPAYCFGKTASMTLKVSLDEGRSATLRLEQKPALRMKFGTFGESSFVTADAEHWPLSSPALADMPTAKDTSSPFYCKEGNLVMRSGHIVKIFSNAGIWYTASTGLNGFGTNPLDKTIGSYLILPAVEGFRLSKVVYHAAAASTKRLYLSIMDKDRSEVVSGGDQKTIGSTAVSRPLLEWTLSETAANTSYSIYQASTGNMYLGDLILYYE